jgi:hypothetical protein
MGTILRLDRIAGPRVEGSQPRMKEVQMSTSAQEPERERPESEPEPEEPETMPEEEGGGVTPPDPGTLPEEPDVTAPEPESERT